MKSKFSKVFILLLLISSKQTFCMDIRGSFKKYGIPLGAGASVGVLLERTLFRNDPLKARIIKSVIGGIAGGIVVKTIQDEISKRWQSSESGSTDSTSGSGRRDGSGSRHSSHGERTDGAAAGATGATTDTGATAHGSAGEAGGSGASSGASKSAWPTSKGPIGSHTSGAGASSGGAGASSGGAAAGAAGAAGAASDISGKGKLPTSKPNFRVIFAGEAHSQGRRTNMEDASVISEIGNFFAVFDGHGGSHVAEYAAQNMEAAIMPHLRNGMTEDQVADEIAEGFRKIHEGCPQRSDYMGNGGSTAIVAIVWEGILYVANLGDARCVLSANGEAVLLSRDMKPEDPHQRKRIEEAGGSVVHWGVFRVVGPSNLSTAGALGDKRDTYVQSECEVLSFALSDACEFLVLTCDGVFEKDLVSNQDAVNIVSESFRNSGKCSEAANKLIDTAYERGSNDNLSAIVVRFK